MSEQVGRTKWLDKIDRQQRSVQQRRPAVAAWWFNLLSSLPLWLLLLTPLFASCTTVRPVVKIGLLAPFEGINRRTGYAALTAMRLAISETNGALAIIPLALDEGTDPETAARAAQKLLLANDVGAIVGPVTPASLAAIASVVPPHAVPWFVPFAPSTSPPTPSIATADSAAQSQQAWLLPLIEAIATLEQQRGQKRLVLAGGSGSWLADAARAAEAPLPILPSDEVASVAAYDAVFWLGSVTEGAHYLCKLRTLHPTVPFWLGPQGDNPLLAERCPIAGPVALVTWLDDGYVDWAQAHDLPSPLAYLTYRATVQAIAQINGDQSPGVPAWRITYFAIQPDGILRLDIDASAKYRSVPDNAVVLKL